MYLGFFVHLVKRPWGKEDRTMKIFAVLLASLSVFASYVPEEEQKGRGEMVYFVNAVIKSEDSGSFKLQMMRLYPDQAKKKAEWLRKADEERGRLEKEFGDSETEESNTNLFWLPDFYGHREDLDRLLAEAEAITGPQVVAEVPACDMPDELKCFSFLVKVKIEKELIESHPGGIQVWRHNFWRWRVVYP
ncbi:MAG: hypothetical protein BWY53_00437 [Parcubacteria group bacterium ADurb.Bin326]|nr:MAG: hypothetical protein BWY53_00437 [Parcubacteria group bacterium ADurb.Bin326]